MKKRCLDRQVNKSISTIVNHTNLRVHNHTHLCTTDLGPHNEYDEILKKVSHVEDENEVAERCDAQVQGYISVKVAGC